jgi:hypothetical protein
MPLWNGAVPWDGSRTWGFADAPPAVVAARTLWDPAIGLRQACFQICAVDPVTWSWSAPLPLVIREGQRRSDIQEFRWRREQLTWQVYDPTGRYLPGGDLEDVLQPNRLVALQWIVQGGGVQQMYQGMVYRLVTTPERSLEQTGLAPFTYTAEDWLRRPLEQPAQAPEFGLVGLTPLTMAILLKDQMLGQGSPVIGAADTWATVTAAQLWYRSGGRVRVTGDWDSVRHPDVQVLLTGQGTDPLAVQVGQAQLTWMTLINFLAWLSRTAIGYDPDGYIRLREYGVRYDSGLVMQCEAPTDAVVRVPLEAPFVRQVTQPEFAAFELWRQEMVPSPPGMGGPAQTLRVSFLASAVSTARDNPFIAGFSRTRAEISQGGFASPVGSFTDVNSYTRYAQAVLQAQLAQADQIMARCDNAFPASDYLGDDVLVQLPPVAQGVYRLVSVQQPLTLQPLTMTLQWVEDR